MLTATQRAFDGVADIYDGPRGNNPLIQRMRELIWQIIAQQIPRGRLLDIGCGTGIDALHFAQQGYSVVATDWSANMVGRTAARATSNGLTDRLCAKALGAQQLDQLDGPFDGAYSNFGPLNCVPDLRAVSRECGRLLAPGGHMVFSVIGRICPWELLHYAVRLKFRRALVRYASGMTPVRLSQNTIWTRYYTPRQFYRHFAAEFSLTHYRALSLAVPPPYLTGLYERARGVFNVLAWLDERTSSWPLFRDAGDHFLMVLARR
jgi:SAM-dependent methyltransferase